MKTKLKKLANFCPHSPCNNNEVMKFLHHCADGLWIKKYLCRTFKMCKNSVISDEPLKRNLFIPILKHIGCDRQRHNRRKSLTSLEIVLKWSEIRYHFFFWAAAVVAWANFFVRSISTISCKTATNNIIHPLQRSLISNA